MYITFARIILCFCIIHLAGCSAFNSQPFEYKTQNNENMAYFNVQLGLAYLQRNDMVHAKQKILLALKEAPDYFEAYTALAYFYQKTDEIKLAQTYYQKAILLAPTQGSVQNNYGVFLCEVGRAPEAIKHFLNAAQNPSYLYTAQAYENAGLCALKIPDLLQARQYLKKALEHDPGNSKILQALQAVS